MRRSTYADRQGSQAVDLQDSEYTTRRKWPAPVIRLDPFWDAHVVTSHRPLRLFKNTFIQPSDVPIL
ncbi:hypothetical protein JYU34_013075 [Plutella xylostella]|uniref:Uncharacterized protein n=1 Tax=Plutella xylostella TaxID=51655 RepID=A0ABQ7QCU7_PLUXY|nr:hypothetical protein JYU34_013075 [Plutella xylostella]